MQIRTAVAVAVTMLALGACDRSTQESRGAPAAPSDLSASVESGGVRLDWSNRDAAAVTLVYRTQASGDEARPPDASFARVAEVAVGVATHLDADVEAGSTYWYGVRARSAGGTSRRVALERPVEVDPEVVDPPDPDDPLPEDPGEPAPDEPAPDEPATHAIVPVSSDCGAAAIGTRCHVLVGLVGATDARSGAEFELAATRFSLVDATSSLPGCYAAAGPSVVGVICGGGFGDADDVAALTLERVSDGPDTVSIREVRLFDENAAVTPALGGALDVP